MNKFLISFGGLLILLGAGGMINHISMVYKAVQEEQEMYGSSVQFMMLQLIGTMGPYLTCLIGGGIIIAIALFLAEYQKRSELTSQLIQVLSEQRSTHNEIETIKSYKKREDQKKTDATITTLKPDLEAQLDTSVGQDDERFYWKG
ncbi:MAG: hypothetical protein ACQEWV_14935 [Bacillota bacterium]